MINIERQLKKGVLAIIVLKMLSRQDMYGYELMQSLAKESGDYYKLKEGSLYPVLYRLEDNDLIKSYWKTEEVGKSVPRKYYSVTDNGKQEILSMIAKWEQFTLVSNSLLGIINKEK